MRPIHLILVGSLLAACASQQHPEPNPGAARQLAKLETLEGEWVGSEASDEAETDLEVRYHRSAGGSVLIETMFPGSEYEMVSAYHLDRDGNLVLTHYCMLGNQPHMLAAPSRDVARVVFTCDGSTVDCARENHMHQGTLAMVNPDLLRTSWVRYENGEAAETVRFELVRKK